MDKYTALVILVVAFFGIGAYVLVNTGIGGLPVPGTTTPDNTVTVQGISTITAMPDRASVFIELREEDDDADDARDTVNEQYDDLRLALLVIGVDDDDIQSTRFSLNPNYRYVNGQRLDDGFIASHSIEVKTNDFDDVGKIIDAAIDADGLVSYINFELSEKIQAELKKQALKEAAEDAKEKAEALAEGSGQRLGTLVTLQSSDFGYRPWPLYAASGGVSADAGVANAEAAKAATNINPSDRDVTASVTAVYRLR